MVSGQTTWQFGRRVAIILGLALPLPGCVVAALFEEPVEPSGEAAAPAAEADEDADAVARDDQADEQAALAAESETPSAFATNAITPAQRESVDLRQPCLDLFPGRTGESLRACRGPDQVQIQAQGRMQILKRRILQARARDIVQAVMTRQQLTLADLGDTRLDLWLTASPLRADDAGWTLVVWTAAGTWRVNLPFNPDAWRLDPQRVAIVSSAGYPSPGSWRPGRILVQAKAHVSPARFSAFVNELGVGQVRNAWPVAAIDVRWFREKEAVQAIKDHVAFAEFVAFIQPEFTREPDRVRRLFDRFNLKP